MASTVTSTEHFARHILRPEDVARESFLYNVKLPDQGLVGLVYTWVDAQSVAGCAAWIYGGNPDGSAIFEIADGIQVPADQGFDAWTVGPLSASMQPSNEGTTVSFAGDRIDVEIEFHPMHERYLYSEAPSGCPSYFADDRMEQSGRVSGQLRIDDRSIPFEALGHHDHSWGTRDWGAVQHYKWLESQAEDTAVHVFDLQAYGERHLAGGRSGTAASHESRDRRGGPPMRDSSTVPHAGPGLAARDPTRSDSLTIAKPQVGLAVLLGLGGAAKRSSANRAPALPIGWPHPSVSEDPRSHATSPRPHPAPGRGRPAAARCS